MMKRIIVLLFLGSFLFMLIPACKTKAKRCAQFDNADSDYKLKRDRNGRVKK